ncbi:hypothetical protein GCK32_007583 [Trichostrongylus colubriformis]|uniref:Uncharacterized protein n=1 Tax=Trichostrongylus colubriformis TaxID=6319 RepID=A0AAN8EUS4_TRICO
MSSIFGIWTWWSTLILLLLRFTNGEETAEPLNITSATEETPTTTTPSGPASADRLGVPRCESNYDCVHNGLCRKDADGYGRCLCPRSCPPYIPMDCMKQGSSSYYRLRQRYRYELPCGVMDSSYKKKYDLPSPQCHQGRCSCPPMFDNWKTSDLPVLNLLPTKCDRRELAVLGIAYPSDAVYKGTDVTLYCCVNMDPQGLIDVAGVLFVQNTTVVREPTNHPFHHMTEFEKMNTPYCWELDIRNVQLSDSGSYMCHVNANQQPSVNYTIEFQVKAPRTIQNLTIVTNDVSANVSWDVQQGPQLKIGLRLVRRTGLNGQEVFSQTNAISPVIIGNLRAATPYKLYVRVQGAVRRMRPGSALVADDFPPPTDEEKCANWDEREDASHGINPIEFTTEFLSCKYGPLKPNRNYTITVWAENSAGRSSPLVFPKHCITNYAQPDVVEKPVTSTNANHTSFNLAFKSKPDDTNGPISCYYIGIVPLLKNVSLETLPPPQEIVMDTVSKAFNNNLNALAAEKKRFFAYIAESYTEYPVDTVIGDGRGVAGMKPCSVLYLSRYKAEDVVLRPGLKYTGFLIVRVDKDDKDEVQGGAHYSRILDPMRPRAYRQLHLSGPAYGFSGYFKPVFLEPEDERSMVGAFLTVLVPLLAFLTMAAVMGLFVLHKRGEVSQWCHWLWMSKESSLGAERTLLRPSTYHAIAVDDLPSEYLMRHRDSDFLFAQEYEALPHYKLDAVASARKENACKNRYNDIRAFDATRVKLRVINDDETTDYINANLIRGWNGRKLFIAAQAPLDTTVADFWRMIWEQDSRLIVMVANLFEKNRQQCTKYWPDDQPTRYGDLLITPQEASYFADYAVRCFDVEPVNDRFNRMSPGARSDVGSIDSNPGSEYANVPSVRHLNGHAETSFVGTGAARRVVQYHFTNWNDYKAPECSTGLLRFLHRLRALPDLETPAKCSFAAKEDNIMKNRFDSAVPYDRNRIVLRASIGYADTTYINASSLKGYFYPYVLAQDPVSESTVFDFWRMISELNVTTLVMLSNEEDWSPSEKYWPSELHGTAVYERPPYNVSVQLTGEEHFPYFIARKLSYRMKEDTGTRNVVQFAFTAWPSSCVVPSSSEPLLSLVGRVLERQSGLPDSGPIVLHCRNGSSETEAQNPRTLTCYVLCVEATPIDGSL